MLRDEPGLVELPDRLSIFGLTRLAASHTELLDAGTRSGSDHAVDWNFDVRSRGHDYRHRVLDSVVEQPGDRQLLVATVLEHERRHGE